MVKYVNLILNLKQEVLKLFSIDCGSFVKASVLYTKVVRGNKWTTVTVDFAQGQGWDTYEVNLLDLVRENSFSDLNNLFFLGYFCHFSMELGFRSCCCLWSFRTKANNYECNPLYFYCRYMPNTSQPLYLM